jgi:hypothetical protein
MKDHIDRRCTARRGLGSRRGYTIVELCVSISALALGLIAAYAAQLSALRLANVARESDVATFASRGVIEMVTARPFTEMIDPDPIAGSVDPAELEALQPPYDPRGYSVFASTPTKYPDAPTKNYVNDDLTLYTKLLAYGVRIWEPVATKTTKTDPANGKSYNLYPLGTLQRAKALVWFEPRPTLLDGVSSTIVKNSSLGYPKLVPQLSDTTDDTTGLPTTVVTAIAWFPNETVHDSNAASTFNPFVLFMPPSDSGTLLTLADRTTLAQRRDALKAKGVRILYNRTVVKG